MKSRIFPVLCILLLLLLPVTLYAATAARIPDGNLLLENGYLDLSPTGKGVIFPDGTVQTTKATGMTGPPGADGTNGKTLLSGTIDPDVGIGVNGDFYINTASNKIFGPKAAGAWPAGVSLMGPKGDTGAQGLSYTPPRAPVLATGQVKSYAVGDDGDWMPGASVATRFFDNGDGTVKDNLTGLIWLKDAGCFATVGGITKGTSAATSNLTWANALTWSNALVGNNTVCGLNDGSTAGQWRLPNRTELMSLVDYSKSSPALPAGHPFSNVQSNYYWSGSTYAGNTTVAWVVYMYDGYVDYGTKTYYGYYVWPVRAGQ